MAAKATPEAEAVTASEDGTPAAAASKKKRLFIGIGVGVMLLIGGGSGAYFTGLFGGTETPSAAEAGTADAAAQPTSVKPTLWSAPDLVVTLNTGERKSRYLKLRTTLELASADDVAKMEAFTPRLIDYCQIYLRELRPDELRGSAAIVRLREELLRRVNLAVAPVSVRNIYFTDIFIE